MPNFSGIWNTTEQFQARAQNIWPAAPGAPTIGTATAGTNNCASVAFTAPACTGRYPAGISSYTAVSTPGCITASGASSPVTVTGLTLGTSYTFRVRATGANGAGPLSGASNSITATLATSAAYTTPGTYSWVAPSGVTSVSVVAVGGGTGGIANNYSNGGSGGGLGYKNNYTVVPGTSYVVVVGAGSSRICLPAGNSSFASTSIVRGGGAGTCGGTFTGDGGGNGGAVNGGGGGAGGYAGNGGRGGTSSTPAQNGSGGGGGGGGNTQNCCDGWSGGGGGVGLFGLGANGAGGSGGGYPSFAPANGGGGGSGGQAGGTSTSSSGAGVGGAYGGGGGSRPFVAGAGGGGAVRIVWCIGGVRGTPSFPSTNVGAP